MLEYLPLVAVMLTFGGFSLALIKTVINVSSKLTQSITGLTVEVKHLSRTSEKMVKASEQQDDRIHKLELDVAVIQHTKEGINA